MRTELKAFIVLWIAVLVVMIGVQQCKGFEISIGLGQGIPVESWQSEGLECSVFQVEVFQDIKPWLYGSLVLDTMTGKLDSSQVVDGKLFEKSTTALAISARLGLQKYLYGGLYGRLFGGFGVKSNDLPEIGDSGVVGHFGAKIGIDWGKWGMGYEWIHMSDPLRSGDKGWNWWILSINREF